MKKVVLIVAMLLMIPLSNVSAASVTLPYYGTTSESEKYMWADKIGGEYEFSYVEYTSHSNDAEILMYKNVGGSATFIGSQSLINGVNSFNLPADVGAIKLKSNDGKEVYLNYAESNTPGNEQIYFEAPTTSPDPEPDTGDCGCVVDIPGWGDMMGKLDEIKSAIPPEPNWQQVANTMRDTIVPAFRDEMENMLGRAPEPLSPPIFNNPLEGGIDEPTGSLPGNFEESGFTANDLKADAEEIQFQEDQSGGFELLDPVGSLPTQEEFKQNIPEEQDLQAPEVPDVTGTAPEPPEQENIAPTPPDVTGTAPNPGNQENIAPEPPDVTGTAPSPSEEDNIAPSPSEGDNVAPTPGDTTGTAPLPGDDTGTAPVPSDDLTTAPLPSDDLTGAPIPSE